MKEDSLNIFIEEITPRTRKLPWHKMNGSIYPQECPNLPQCIFRFAEFRLRELKKEFDTRSFDVSSDSSSEEQSPQSSEILAGMFTRTRHGYSRFSISEAASVRASDKTV